MIKSQNRNFKRASLALIAISLAGALGAAAPAAATPTYDGLWSVVIVTQKGSCDKAYRYPVRIANGAVQNDGPSLINVSGKVGGNGAVTVRASPAEFCRLRSRRGSIMTPPQSTLTMHRRPALVARSGKRQASRGRQGRRC
jgi:hypothetical protein